MRHIRHGNDDAPDGVIVPFDLDALRARQEELTADAAVRLADLPVKVCKPFTGDGRPASYAVVEYLRSREGEPCGIEVGLPLTSENEARIRRECPR